MVEEKEKKSKEFWIKVLFGAVFVISWLILIGWKTVNKDLSLKTPLIITIIISLISVIAFFGNNIQKFIKKKEEGIPKSLNEKEIEEIIKQVVEKMWNHLKINNGIEWMRSRTIQKNIIYAYKVNLLYEESFGDSCIIIINATYPEIIPTILPSTMSEYYIDRAMNWKSQNPFDEPDIKVTETKFDDFGKPIQKVKETKHKKKEKKEDVV